MDELITERAQEKYKNTLTNLEIILDNVMYTDVNIYTSEKESKGIQQTNKYSVRQALSDMN